MGPLWARKWEIKRTMTGDSGVPDDDCDKETSATNDFSKEPILQLLLFPFPATRRAEGAEHADGGVSQLRAEGCKRRETY